MKVLAYDKYVPADEIRRRGAEPSTASRRSSPGRHPDCHTPLTDETRAMINDTSSAHEEGRDLRQHSPAPCSRSARSSNR